MQTDVLILADGIVAKHFLQRLAKSEFCDNLYHIVYTDDQLKEIASENFIFYKFDPTSFVKLSSLLHTKTFKEVMVLLANKIDTIASYENVRKISKNMTIVIFDRWDLNIEDRYAIFVNANEVLASIMFDHLPNVPVLAQNIGLGKGEIMEVLVPFGSSYVYRHIGSIEQKKWRIAAIYRNNRLILPEPHIMIWPNDLLLLIGDPDVLKQVYKMIKREVGQFPMPYGINSYLFIDMESESPFSIKRNLLYAIYLHQKFKDKKLFIRVVNPNNIELLELIKKHDGKDVEVLIDYFGQDGQMILTQDIKRLKIGLLMVCNKLFLKRKWRKLFYSYKIPVLSLADQPIQTKEAGLILDKEVEKISAVVFDITIQLQLQLQLFSKETPPETIEHFENLATIFSKPIQIKKVQGNIIRHIKEQKNILLFFPFTQKVLNAHPLNIFCTDPYALFYKLSQFHQLFLPLV